MSKSVAWRVSFVDESVKEDITLKSDLSLQEALLLTLKLNLQLHLAQDAVVTYTNNLLVGHFLNEELLQVTCPSGEIRFFCNGKHYKAKKFSQVPIATTETNPWATAIALSNGAAARVAQMSSRESEIHIKGEVSKPPTRLAKKPLATPRANKKANDQTSLSGKVMVNDNASTCHEPARNGAVPEPLTQRQMKHVGPTNSFPNAEEYQTILPRNAVEPSRCRDAQIRRSAIWNELAAGRPFDELRDSLTKISNSLSHAFDAKSIPDEFYKTAFSSSVPLVTIAEKLIPMAQHYQVWDEVLRKLNRVRMQQRAEPLDWKTAFLMMQFYLHPSKAMMLTERLAEMNRPVPFIAIVKRQEDVGQSVLEEARILLQNFRNLFEFQEHKHNRGRQRLLLSIGCEFAKGKSKFLNRAFGCEFPVQSGGPFHDLSVDVSVSTKDNPLPFHILDCHGSVSKDIIIQLSKLCPITLVHISEKTAETQKTFSWRQMLEILNEQTTVVILLRQHVEHIPVGESARSEITSLLKGLVPQPPLILVPYLADGDEFEMDFQGVIEDLRSSIVVPSSAGRWYYNTYGQLEETMMHMGGICGVSARSQSCLELARTLDILLRSLQQNPDINKTVFPRSAMHTRKLKLEDKLKKLNMRTAAQQHDAEEAIRLRMIKLERRLRAPLELHALVQTFLDVLLSKEVDQFDELSANVRAARVFGVNLEIAQFWQETMLCAQYMSVGRRIEIVASSKMLLDWGYPQEVLNGESLAIADTDCLQKILMEESGGRAGKGVLVCSVIGPQSSAKSTLVNYLFGSTFKVSAGRCTKGMHMSLFDTERMGISNLSKLVVLDTEGLMSSTARDSAFDKQMTLMALALSNVVLINIKGEIGKEMNDVLHVTFLALKKLSIIHAKPKLLFVLRDMTDLDPARQKETVERIQT